MEIIKEYQDKLYKVIKETPDEYVETGQISGSKIAQPTLTAVLTMLGVEKPFDDYTLAKFMRGHDVEAKFIERVFHKPVDVKECESWNCEDSHFTWQYEMKEGYRGCTCSVDVFEESEFPTIHEIKSVSKMKWDNITASGFRKKNEVKPDYSHCLQVTLYALSYKNKYGVMPRVLIHYVNADDYRVATFDIDPLNYKEELDRRIDAIYEAFLTHTLPAYIPYEDWQKGKYNSFQELEKLDEYSINEHIKTAYPNIWKKFNKAIVTTNLKTNQEGGILYDKNW